MTALAVMAIPVFQGILFVILGAGASRENVIKTEKFIKLPPLAHRHLIEISQEMDEGFYGEIPASTVDIPDEFKEFGFYGLWVEENRLTGFLYSSFDSGGKAVVDWSTSNNPTIVFVEGDYDDIITKVYPSDIESDFGNMLKKSGVESYFDSSDSAEGDTLVTIGDDTNYTAETVMEMPAGKILKIRSTKQ